MSKPYELRILDYLRNYRDVAMRVKGIVESIDPEAEIYVFGSVVRGRFTAASDIDILIITKHVEKKYEIMVKVYRAIEAPVELHIATPEQFRRWYKRFISDEEIVKI